MKVYYKPFNTVV